MFVQKPQFIASVITFVQLKPHCCRPVAHVVEHMLCEHKSPPVQTFPHVPQFAGSAAVFEQVVPHAIRPDVHAHWPALQLWPGPQALLHVPQLRRSVATVVQTPLQLSCPTAHMVPPPVPVPPVGDVPPVPVPAAPLVPPTPLSESSSESFAPPVTSEQLAMTTRSPTTESPTVIRMSHVLPIRRGHATRKPVEVPRIPR